MPKSVKKFYELTGWAEVLIYSESEMANVLGVTRGQLRESIGRGELVYHAHPFSDTIDEGYEFTPSTYIENIARWECLSADGHHFILDYWLVENKRAAWKCERCPAKKFD